MTGDKSQEFRASLGMIIGRDVVYLTATDETKHFDPVSLALQYGGVLFSVFLTSAAGAVWDRAQEEARNAGKKVGQRLGNEFVRLIGKLKKTRETTNDAEQIRQIQTATDTLQLLGNQIARSYLSDFTRAGERAVEKRLRADNFPDDKAKRISREFGKAIRAHAEL